MPSYSLAMLSADYLASAERLPDGSLLLERADSDEELAAEALLLGEAGWELISRRERPGQTTVVTWAKSKGS